MLHAMLALRRAHQSGDDVPPRAWPHTGSAPLAPSFPLLHLDRCLDHRCPECATLSRVRISSALQAPPPASPPLMHACRWAASRASGFSNLGKLPHSCLELILTQRRLLLEQKAKKEQAVAKALENQLASASRACTFYIPLPEFWHVQRKYLAELT